ncbi:MAG: DNA methyltransferase [Candidatus Hodarchaeota archaeon]
MNDHIVLYGDVWAGLSTIEDNSIDCVVTSPPYWSQRNYYFKGQIGNEPSLQNYFKKLVTIFRLLRKKLKFNGVFFLNLGDKYLSKYGNAPLGMIPYRLAYYLVENGWKLEEILIWYKTNHMPSSVKNRFTNTYEPIFVLVKHAKNYYSKFKKNNDSINILKIPLQPLPYKHMATFPEKLVEALLERGIPDSALVLDPFGGSGTTTKAVQNLSNGYFNPRKMRSVIIEANKEYIRIIKKRCKIPTHCIRKIPYKDFKPLLPLKKRQENNHTAISSKNFDLNSDHVIIKLFSSSEEFNSFIPNLYQGKLAKSLSDDGVCFLGLLDPNINDINTITYVNNHGWIIRNMIVVPKEDVGWIPIFMLVKDIKSVRYQFNLDIIRVEHKTSSYFNWDRTDFTGYRVVKPLTIFKKPEKGLITKVLSYFPNGLPHWLVVQWNSVDYSLEEVINESNDSKGIEMSCPRCQMPLIQFYHYQTTISCPSCSLQLWKDINSIPVLTELNPRVEPTYQHEKIDVQEKNIKKSAYNGKFKDADRINIGQSPGARASIQDQYFSMMRYYDVQQSMISDYLNIYRKKIGLTKKGLTEKFPPEYKHTVGHWLRKDMGGSLPKIKDLQKLEELIGLGKSYVNYISRVGLKLQTVLTDTRGKNPGDFLELPLKKVIQMLKRVGE